MIGKDYTQGNIWRNITDFALPYMLAYFLQMLYGLTDLFVVLGVEIFFLTFGFSEAELSTMSAILLIVIGIMVHYEVCKPFDWKRRVLWGAMAGSSAVTILGFGGSFGLSPLGTQAFLVLLVFLGLAYSIMRFMLGLFDQGERLLNRGRHLRKRR